MATISTPKKLFNPATVLTRNVSVTAASDLAIKEGHIIVIDNTSEAYEAVAKDSLDFSSALPSMRCVIALEDVAVGSVAKDVKCIVGGDVYIPALRDYGYTAAKVTPVALDILGGLSNINFIEEA